MCAGVRAFRVRACGIWFWLGLTWLESFRLVPEFFSGFSFTPNPLRGCGCGCCCGCAALLCSAVTAVLLVLRSSFSFLGFEGFAFVLINQVQAEPIDGFASIGLARKRIWS